MDSFCYLLSSVIFLSSCNFFCLEVCFAFTSLIRYIPKYLNLACVFACILWSIHEVHRTTWGRVGSLFPVGSRLNSGCQTWRQVLLFWWAIVLALGLILELKLDRGRRITSLRPAQSTKQVAGYRETLSQKTELQLEHYWQLRGWLF